MNDEQKYHLINQYLNGELMGRALDNFKAELKDPEFQKEVELQRQIIEAIKKQRKAELKAYISENSKVTYFQNSWGNKWNYASAAIVILFVSAFFIMKFYNPNPNSTEIVVTEKPDTTSLAQEDSITQLDTQTLAIQDVTIPNVERADEDVDSEIEESPEDIELDETADKIEETNTDAGFQTEDEELVPTAEKSANRVSPNADLEVKKDQLLSTKSFTVVMFSPNFGTGAGKTSNSDSNKTVSDTEITTAKTSERYKENTSRILQVEFWKSPVNFKGYQYSNSGLKLYDISEDANLVFKELDGRLYMKTGSKYYYLEKNSAYNKFVEVKNSTLLKALNE